MKISKFTLGISFLHYFIMILPGIKYWYDDVNVVVPGISLIKGKNMMMIIMFYQFFDFGCLKFIKELNLY